LAEPTSAEWEELGVIEFALCNFSRTSLVGKAREHICETAVDWGADYLFFWDDDMRFEYSAFLRLWRHQKPVVAALAFTARHPIHAVIYSIQQKYDSVNNMKVFESSVPVFDYPKDKLITNEDIGGELAFGAAVMLIDCSIFDAMPQPWFASTACGEDWFFCSRMSQYGIPRYMDTGVKTQHKAHSPVWCDEDAYWKYREDMHESYQMHFGEMVERPEMAVADD
jgi:hypothetical protein